MSQQSETGHGKNLANLLKYNQFLATLGATYNPPLAGIGLTAMDALYTSAKQDFDIHKLAAETWKMETNKREIAFGTLASFSTRLLGILRSTNAPQQTLDDFSAHVGRVRGGGKRDTTPKPEVEPTLAAGDAEVPVPRTHSSSQLSFDQRLENFSKMILLLKAVPDYTPTEPDLSITGLEAHYADLLTMNNNATKADATLRAARTKRNNVLYAEGTGVVALVKKSKAYILGIYGRNSQEYQNAVSYKIVGLKF